jgi:hypothetical protein
VTSKRLYLSERQLSSLPPELTICPHAFEALLVDAGPSPEAGAAYDAVLKQSKPNWKREDIRVMLGN